MNKTRTGSLKAVTFDLYDTLLITDQSIDQTTLSAKVVSRFLRQDGVDINPTEAEVLFTTPIDRSDRRELTYFELRIDTFLRNHGVAVEHATLTRYAELILDSWERRWSLVDDAVPTLTQLRSYGIRLALISNFDHHPFIHRLTDKLDITTLFDHVVVSSEIKSDKPDSQIFLNALSALDCTPGQALHVGDRVPEDVQGALNVGMQAVQIDHYNKFDSSDTPVNVPLIRSLTSLLDMVS